MTPKYTESGATTPALLATALVALGLAAVVVATWEGWHSAAADVQPSESAKPGLGRAGPATEASGVSPSALAPVSILEERTSLEPQASDRAPVGGVVSGTVVDLETGAGIEGIRVRLFARGQGESEATSDSVGAFRLAAFNGRQTVWVHAPPGWRATPARFECQSDYWRGCEPPRFELELLETGPLRARVTDKSTGEAVPDCEVALQGSAAEVVTTDRSGALVSTREFAAGPVVALVSSGPGAPPQRVEFEHTPGGGAALLEVDVGPTYAVSFVLPGGTRLEEFQAFLRPAGSMETFPPLGEFSRRDTGQLRAGPPWWVRIPRDPRGAGPLELCVLRTEGGWFGSAAVERIEGVSSEVVPIWLSQGGALTVAAVSAAGQPLGSVALTLTSAEGRAMPRPVPAGELGQYAWTVLPAGAYQLTAGSGDLKSVPRTVSVAPGEHAIVRVALELEDTGLTLEGVVRSRSGEFSRYLSVLAIPLDGARPMRSTRIRLARDEPGVGSFRFTNLPRGDYRVRVGDTHFASTPSSLLVTPPAGHLVFELIDDVPTKAFAMHVSEAQSGAPIDRVHVSYSLETGATHTLEATRASVVTLGRFPVTSGLQWTVEADGYTPTRGDQTAFAKDPGQDDRRLARVVLEAVE